MKFTVPYADTIDRRYREGHITYETWRRHQNKLLQWMSNGV